MTEKSLESSKHNADNRAFWEGRGQAGVCGHAVTMMAEHGRYLGYVHDAEVRFLRDHLRNRPGGRILDFGCGTGRLAIALAPLAREIVGLEPAGSLVTLAREAVAAKALNNVHIDQAGLDNPQPSASFDTVILSGVLNCLDDEWVVEGLRNAAQALVPGGLLVVRKIGRAHV